MSLATDKQTTAHPSSHDEGGVCELEGSGDRYPPDFRMDQDKFIVDIFDGRDPESDESGQIRPVRL